MARSVDDPGGLRVGGKPLLELEKVSRQFGGVAALRDVSLVVDRERICGLIGPNGAGKTTLVNLVTGLLKVSTGRILCRGVDITTYSPHRVTRVGLARTFQNVRLFGAMTPRANVLVALDRTSGVWRHESARKRRADADALLERVGLRPTLDEARNLPYGDQRRLEIARALALRPALLLLDEPAAGMNNAEADALAGLLRDLVGHDGCSILVIEHNLRFVRDLCGEVYVLDQGSLIGHGSVDAVFTDPLVKRAYVGG